MPLLNPATFSFLVLAGLLMTTACKSNAPTQRTSAEPQLSRHPVERSGTNIDGIDTSDTLEDPDYAVAGEAIASQAAAVLVGQPAPLALMETIDGQSVDLGEVYGTKPVYIKFWATWCVPCRQQMPGFQRLYEEHGDDMEIIAVNIGLSDDMASVRGIQKKYGLTMPIVFDDGHLASLFNLAVTPQHVLIGRDARVAYVGHAENALLDKAIERVLSDDSTPAPAQTTEVKSFTPLTTGDIVPELTVTTSAGDAESLKASGPGKVRALQFFSSWCEWYLEETRPVTAQACARTRTAIAELSPEHPNIEWLGIAGGPWATAQDLADYQTKHSIRIPLALDPSGALFRTFGIRDIPTVILVDATGRILRILAPDENLASATGALGL